MSVVNAYSGPMSVALGVGIGFFIGWMFRSRYGRRQGSVESASSSLLDECQAFGDTGEIKLVLCVRMDLKMGKGKMAAQCSHAAVGCYKKISETNPIMLEQWEFNGQPKITVKVDGEQTLSELRNHARALGLCNVIIADAGRTQIATGSRTVLGVGPGPAEIVDKVTGHLKLL